MADADLPLFAQAIFSPIADDGRPTRYVALYGGRGSAKSHSFAAALIIMARQKPLRILCCREIQRSIRDSVKRLLDAKIDAMGWGFKPDGDQFFTSLESEIRGKNGSLFTFAGLRSNIDSVKSTEGIDIAYVSEARSVSQSSWDVLIPTVRNDGSRIFVDWNPEKPDDPVDVMFRGDVLPPGSIVRRVNFDQNPWFPDVLRTDMDFDRSRDVEKYNHVWLGEYKKRSEARVFKRVTIEPCPEPPPGTTFLFGADWGYSIDPSVLLRMWIDGRTLYIDREAYRVGCDMQELPKLFAGRAGAEPGEEWTPGLEAAYPGIEDVKRWEITADSARPETIAYMRRAGFRMSPAKKGAGSIDEGIEWLQSFDIVIDPQCKNAGYEFTTYSFKVDKLTGQVLPILEDKRNHTIDSARYATEKMHKKGIDYRAWA